MAYAIIKIVIMLFVSILFLMLSAYSTVFKARAKRSFVVYEVVAAFLIISDHNLTLGIIEFILFQIIAIFSTISCLYAYAEIEINEKKTCKDDHGMKVEKCTALIKAPLKREVVEIDQDTINIIQELALHVFIACMTALLIIRPVLLFPFYGKNAVLFMFGMAIVIVNFYISIVGGNSRRAIKTNDTGWATSFVFVFLFAFLAYGFIQLIGLFVYMDADEKAQKNNIIQDCIPASYGKMLPINKIYEYEEQVPGDFWGSHSYIADDTYLIQYKVGNQGDKYYYNLYGSDKIQTTVEGVDNAEVYIHLIDAENDDEPRVDIYPTFYVNPRGEEDIAKYTYHFYLKEEQIITY